MSGDLMRLAYVCADPGVPVFGRKAASVRVLEVLRALHRRGTEVELFAVRYEGGGPSDLQSIPRHQLPPLPRADRAARERAALRLNRDLAEALERRGPFDAVYERYSRWSFAAMEHAQQAGIPGLLEVNAPVVGLAGEAAFAAASHLLAVSSEVAARLAAHDAAGGCIAVVPNGVDPDRFGPGVTPSCSGPPGSFTIGFVGTLKVWHGLGVLVDAYGRVRRESPECRLLVVGDGPERARMQADLADRGVADGVCFTGAAAPDDVPALLASMDAAVIPYGGWSAPYFSPLRLYEYMAAGLPIAASGIGHVADVLKDRVTGLVFPPGDSAALAAALTRFRADPALRRRLGEAARRAVLRDHTWDGVAGLVLGLAGRARGDSVRPKVRAITAVTSAPRSTPIGSPERWLSTRAW